MEPDDPYHIVSNSVMRLCFSRAWESIAIGNFRSGSLVKIPPTLAGMGKENVWRSSSNGSCWFRPARRVRRRPDRVCMCLVISEFLALAITKA